MLPGGGYGGGQDLRHPRVAFLDVFSSVLTTELVKSATIPEPRFASLARTMSLI